MKATYCEYLEISSITGELYNPCGDRAIINIDARLTLDNAHKVAIENNGVRRPKFAAYQLFTGELNRPSYKAITKVIELGD